MPHPPAKVDASTTQVCAADRAGNLVSLRTSLGEGFGSKVLIPATGIFMNNSLQAFNPEPGHANSLAPGKRPAMIAPAVVVLKQGRPVAAIAASGGRRTTAAAIHTMVHLADFGMTIQEAIEWPRLHCEMEEAFIDARVPTPVQEALRQMGHPLVAVEETVATANFGRPVGVSVDEHRGLLHGGADPLRSTGVAGW